MNAIKLILIALLCNLAVTTLEATKVNADQPVVLDINEENSAEEPTLDQYYRDAKPLPLPKIDANGKYVDPQQIPPVVDPNNIAGQEANPPADKD